MRFVRYLTFLIVGAAALTVSGLATTGPSISGGGSTSGMTRFALAIHAGTGHFECLMPAAMTVEATVTSVDAATLSSASFQGTAQVTLAAGNPFGLAAGPMVRSTSFTATVHAGGPGQGYLDLEILGMSFNGTVEHGRISVTP